jgi:hypothetical protein
MLLSKLEAKKMGVKKKEDLTKELTPEIIEAKEQYREFCDNRSKQSDTLLEKYLPLIKENQQLILNTPEYFFVKVPASLRIQFGRFIGVANVCVTLSIGVLIKLWNDGTLIMPCEKCNNGRVHIYWWWGDILHNPHYRYFGICDSCGDIASSVYKEEKSSLEKSLDPIQIFKERVKHARRISASNENTEVANIIDPGVPQHFSWSKGLVPAIPAIKQVIKPKVIPVSFIKLIEILFEAKLTKELKILTWLIEPIGEDRRKELTPEEVKIQNQYREFHKNTAEQSSMLLQKYLSLIKENQELILKTPEYFFSESPATNLTIQWGQYECFSVDFPIGVLIKLWNDGTLIMPCEKCNNGNVHIFSWWGDVMYPQYDDGAGSYEYWGICDSCGNKVYVRKEGKGNRYLGKSSDPIHAFRVRAEHARKVSVANLNEEIANIIDPGTPQHFSWSEGLVPAIPPIKQVIKPKVIPISFTELIHILLGSKLTTDLKISALLAKTPQEKSE